MNIKTNILIILVLSIFSTSIVQASFPQYTTTELFKNNMINGDNNFGDLLFLAQPYTPTNYIKGTINNFSVQKYDVMKWIGTNNIRLKAPNGQEMILINGSDYYFTQSGQYIMTDLLNSSITTNITSIPEDINNITLGVTQVPTGFSLSFSKTNFTLLTEDIVRANLDVDDDVKTGNYVIKYTINGVEKSKSFTVEKNSNWTMNTANFTFNNNIKAGEGKYIGRIVATNNGNIDLEFTITKSGTGIDMITIPGTQTLFRKNSAYIDIQAQVPTIKLSGNYSVTLNLTAGNISQAVQLNITVYDSINPVIENITYSSDKVYVANDITVIATDNNDVVNVTMKYDNVVKQLSKDKNIFTTQIKFDKLSRYIIEICAYDSAGNKDCKIQDKIFNKVTIINNATTAYKMPSVKYGKYSRMKLFTINDKFTEGVTLTLIDLKMNQVGNYTDVNTTIPRATVRIVDSKNAIKTFPEVGSITVYEKGDVFLEVRSDLELNVDGTIRADLPEQYQEISDMTFKVSFKTYDVPEDFKVNWIDDKELKCKVKDTGDLDTSYYDCNLQYPVGIVPTDISIPTTVGERDKFKNEAIEIQAALDKQKTRSGFYIAIVAFMLICTLLWGLYRAFWYPYVRFQTGSKKTVKLKDGREL